ncbi:hypothetical protein GCM10022268_36590 [Sphingomonas cynarae]|uniref:Uncharacterized protein n=1 Tax=Sphingomonas cynarae TaxID=930197 RepID=A0ABP7EY03_9SPHN
MVGIAANADSKKITIYGHGLSVAQAFALAPGIRLEPDTPAFSLDSTVDGCASFSDYAAVVQGRDLATFCSLSRRKVTQNNLPETRGTLCGCFTC